MRKPEITVEYADYFQHPKVVEKDYTQFTHGDGHGSALLFLYQLIRDGFLQLKNGMEDYQKLRECFCKIVQEVNSLEAPDSDLQKKYAQYFDIFFRILDEATVHNTEKFFRSVGDLLAGVGNDLLTLAIIHKLFVSGLRFEILVGNHDFGFLEAWANDFKNPKAFGLSELQSFSYTSLYRLLAQGVYLEKKGLDDLVENFYLPNLRLLSYSEGINGEKDSIFLHADVSQPRKLLCKLAEYYQLPFNSETADDTEVKNLINEINRVFLERILGPNRKEEIAAIHKSLSQYLKDIEKMRFDRAKKYYERLSKIPQRAPSPFRSFASRSKPESGLETLFMHFGLSYNKACQKKFDGKDKIEKEKKFIASFRATLLNDFLPKLPKELQAHSRSFIQSMKLRDPLEFQNEINHFFNFLPVELFLILSQEEIPHFDKIAYLKAYADKHPDETLEIELEPTKVLQIKSTRVPEEYQPLSVKELTERYKNIQEKNRKGLALTEPEEMKLRELNALKQQEKQYQNALTHDITYQHAPFAPLFWERRAEMSAYKHSMKYKKVDSKLEQQKEKDFIERFNWVHGHDGPEPDKGKDYFNLDSLCGRIHFALEDGEYTVNYARTDKEEEWRKTGQFQAGPHYAIKTYENSDRFPQEPTITTQKRNEVLGKHEAEIEDLLHKMLEACQHYQSLLGPGKTEAPPRNEERPAPQMIPLAMAKTPLADKREAVDSFIKILSDQNLKPKERLHRFLEEKSSQEKKIAQHQNYILQHPALFIALVIIGTLMTAIVPLILMAAFAIRSKLNRHRATFNFGRSNGDLFLSTLDQADRTEISSLLNKSA